MPGQPNPAQPNPAQASGGTDILAPAVNLQKENLSLVALAKNPMLTQPQGKEHTPEPARAPEHDKTPESQQWEATAPGGNT